MREWKWQRRAGRAASCIHSIEYMEDFPGNRIEKRKANEKVGNAPTFNVAAFLAGRRDEEQVV